MATTSATEKQADAIKQRMAEIRTELPYSADIARNRVKQLTDWKYHLTRHPVPIVAAVIATGFLLVPSKRSAETIVIDRSDNRYLEPPAKKGLVSGVAGALATIALKQITSIAASQLSSLLTYREEP